MQLTDRPDDRPVDQPVSSEEGEGEKAVRQPEVDVGPAEDGGDGLVGGVVSPPSNLFIVHTLCYNSQFTVSPFCSLTTTPRTPARS